MGTKKVIRNIRNAEKWGADIIVSTLPFYYSINDKQEQLQFFEAVHWAFAQTTFLSPA